MMMVLLVPWGDWFRPITSYKQLPQPNWWVQGPFSPSCQCIPSEMTSVPACPLSALQTSWRSSKNRSYRPNPKPPTSIKLIQEFILPSPSHISWWYLAWFLVAQVGLFLPPVAKNPCREKWSWYPKIRRTPIMASVSERPVEVFFLYLLSFFVKVLTGFSCFFLNFRWFFQVSEILFFKKGRFSKYAF